MTRSDLQAWLDRYVAAWRANDRQLIADLFTEDAVYRFHPYDHGDQIAVGREAIVTAWLESPDDPEWWEAAYEAFAVDGDRAVAVGTTSYRATGDHPARRYHNCYLMRFDKEGRCAEFTEFFMRVPGR